MSSVTEKPADLWNRAQQLAGRLRDAADVSELAESTDTWPFTSDSEARSFVSTSENMSHTEMSRELKTRLEQQDSDSTRTRDPPEQLAQWNTYQSLASSLLQEYETDGTVTVTETATQLPARSRIIEQIQTLTDSDPERPTVELARWLQSSDAHSTRQNETAHQQVARELLESYYEGTGNIQESCRTLSQHVGYTVDAAQVRIGLASFDGCSRSSVDTLAERISTWEQNPEQGPTPTRIRAANRK